MVFCTLNRSKWTFHYSQKRMGIKPNCPLKDPMAVKESLFIVGRMNSAFGLDRLHEDLKQV